MGLFQQQIDTATLIDRRLGAPGLLTELREQIARMCGLQEHELRPKTRTALARVIVDACTLAGWLCLDQSVVLQAWQFYNRAGMAAREAESCTLQAYAYAAQSVVLLDIDEASSAVELTEYARAISLGKAPGLLASWRAAAHGEACAAAGLRDRCLEAFDEASSLLQAADSEEVPFLVFGALHLARWRGNALARLGDREAIDVLSSTLDQLDASFTPAETAVRVDLARALHVIGEQEAASIHAERALTLARQIGSARHRRRLDSIRIEAVDSDS